MNKRLYNIWACMKQRCSNPKHTAAAWYHDKGIRVCDEWLKYKNFERWALENGYSDDLTIDRVDSDKNYEPSNCRWITISQNRKKALESRGKSRKVNRKGKFMVVVGSYPISPFSLVKVVKTGLPKTEALKLSHSLWLEHRYERKWFDVRVTDGFKEDDRVCWGELRAYLNH